MKRRNPIFVALAGIFTLGVYYMYWLHKTGRALAKLSKLHVPSIWWMILSFVIVVVPYAFFFASAFAQPEESEAGAAFFLLFGAIWLAILVSTAIQLWWLFKYGKAAGVFTKGDYNTAISLLLLYFLGSIGAAILQDKFNELDAKN